MKNLVVGTASVVMLVSGCAAHYRVTPIENPPATISYDRGAPTTSLEQRNGGVQVTPMQLDGSGRLVFGIAVYNSSDRSVTFGTENIENRSLDNKRLRIYTANDLIREARNKAIAADVAIALLSVAAAAASNAAAHQTYHSTIYTPQGAYHYKASYYNHAQAIAGTADAIGAGTAGIYAVHQSLDAAIAGIGESVLQETTVAPGESVAGRLLVQRPRGEYPQELAMLVHWNGEDYPFRFQVSKVDRKNPQGQQPVHAAARSSNPPIVASTPSAAPAQTVTSTATVSAKAATDAASTAPVREKRPDPEYAEPPPARHVVAVHQEVPAEAVDADAEYNARMWKEQEAFAK